MKPSVDELNAINWDFPTSLPGVGTSLHWYPGTFPNALPATLIEAFTISGATVFDPYGGVGTTGFEALRQGRNAILTDANPIATAIAMFSCTLLLAHRISPVYALSILEELSLTIAQESSSRQSTLEVLPLRLELVDGGIAGAHLRALNKQAQDVLTRCVLDGPDVEALSPWFHKQTLEELLSLYECLQQPERSPLLRLSGLVMISAIARSSSSQTASWGHVADNVFPKEFKYKSVYYQCKRWLAKVGGVLRDVEHSRVASDHIGRAAVYQLNWLHEPSAEMARLADSVDLMITSPPYSSAIDYILSQRLSHYIFGFSAANVMRFVGEETGARRKRFQAAPEEIWATELATNLESQLLLLKDDGVICVILPHKDSGRHLGAIAVDTILKDHGWRNIWSGNRSIRQSRTRQSWTSIQKEVLLVFGGRRY